MANEIGYKWNAQNQERENKLKEEASISKPLAKSKMEKLVPGKFYWILTETWIKDSCRKTWVKCLYVGECGKDNCLLCFERQLRSFTNDIISYKLTYHKWDYFHNYFKILTDDEYHSMHSKEVWGRLDEVLSAIKKEGE